MMDLTKNKKNKWKEFDKWMEKLIKKNGITKY